MVKVSASCSARVPNKSLVSDGAVTLSPFGRGNGSSSGATWTARRPDAVWVKLVIAAAPKGVGMDQFLTGDQASITVKR